MCLSYAMKINDKDAKSFQIHIIIHITVLVNEQGISIHWKLNCLHNRFSGYPQRKHQSSVLLALDEGNPPATGGFPS